MMSSCPLALRPAYSSESSRAGTSVYPSSFRPLIPEIKSLRVWVIVKTRRAVAEEDRDPIPPLLPTPREWTLRFTPAERGWGQVQDSRKGGRGAHGRARGVAGPRCRSRSASTPSKNEG